MTLTFGEMIIMMISVGVAVSVDEFTLTHMVAELTPEVALVLQMPFVCTRKGFASTYEQVCYTQHGRGCLLLLLFFLMHGAAFKVKKNHSLN